MSRLSVQEQAFLKSVQSGSVSAVRARLSAGESPNVAADRPDITPLHEAVIQGDLLMVKVLVGGGAKLNVADRVGDFPLDTAIAEDHPQIAEYLRSCGARRHDEDDLTPEAPISATAAEEAGEEATTAQAAFDAAARAALEARIDAAGGADAFRLRPRPPRGPGRS